MGRTIRQAAIQSYQYSQPAIVDLACVTCGKEFTRLQEGRQNPGRFCRSRCATKERIHKRDCVVCTRILKPKQKFTCSKACRIIRNAARRNAENAVAMPVPPPEKRPPKAPKDKKRRSEAAKRGHETRKLKELKLIHGQLPELEDFWPLNRDQFEFVRDQILACKTLDEIYGMMYVRGALIIRTRLEYASN